MKRRVVITGIGIVSVAGIGKDNFFSFLQNPGNIAVKIPYKLPYSNKSKFYIPLPEIDLSDFQIPTYYKFLQKEDLMTIAAAKLALEDGGIYLNSKSNKFYTSLTEKAAIVIGTGFVGIETAFHSFLSHIGIDYTPKIKQKKVTFNRMIIPRMMSNSPASWTSILFDVHGESFTLNASCASGTFAIGEAYRKIKDGYINAAITGGVENLSEETFALFRGFDSLGVLTKSVDGFSQPFSKNRSGFLFSEGGACILLIEELQTAISRKADIYAEILDYRTNSDSFQIVQMDPNGKNISKLLQELKSIHKIDYLNAHGTGTVVNDQIEMNIIQEVFGSKDNQPLINSTKGLIGHTIGASGAIETAVTALAIKNNFVHRNLITESAENMNLPLTSIYTKIDKAITVSYGFGGHNAGLLLGAYNG